MATRLNNFMKAFDQVMKEMAVYNVVQDVAGMRLNDPGSSPKLPDAHQSQADFLPPQAALCVNAVWTCRAGQNISFKTFLTKLDFL